MHNYVQKLSSVRPPATRVNMRLKYMYSVISVKMDSLRADIKNLKFATNILLTLTRLLHYWMAGKSVANCKPSRLAALSIQWCRSISDLGIKWPPPVDDNGILHATPSPRLPPSFIILPPFPSGARTRLLSSCLDAPTMAFFPLLLTPRLHALMMEIRN